MSSLVSIKQILIKNDVFDKDKKDTKRGTAHEFQDYAYRLASDLNDRDNLHIYMRLAKNVERSVLERAFSYAIDANSPHLGRIFFWKLKTIRADIAHIRELTNFEYSFVMKKARKLRDLTAKTVIANNDEKYESNIGVVINRYILSADGSDALGKKALMLGNDSTTLPSILLAKGMKTYGIDVSSKLTNTLKDNFSFTKQAKFIVKDFLKNTYGEKCFDLIVVNKFWQIIPLEKELEYINQLKRILCNDGKIILGVKLESEMQSWKEIILGGNSEMVFQKTNGESNLENKIDSMGLKIIHRFDINNMSYYYLSLQ